MPGRIYTDAMCGIAGVAGGVDGARTREALGLMTAALRHRGPDDSGDWLDQTPLGLVGLCATRLAVQDTSTGGHQPMVSRLSGA